MKSNKCPTYWSAIVLSYSALLVLGLLDNLRGPYFPDITRDLHLSDEKASWIFTLASFTGFIGSYFASKMLRIFSVIGGMRIGIAFMMVGFFGFSLMNNFVQLLVATALFGIGLGLIQVVQHTLIQDSSDEQHRRRLFNGLHSMYGFSALFAPLGAGYFYGLGWPWRKGIYLLGFLPLIPFVQSFFVQSGGQPQQGGQVAEEVDVHKRDIKRMLYLAVAISFYVSAELLVSSRLVLYVRRTLKVSPAKSTNFLTLFFVLLMIGRLMFFVFKFKKISSRAVLISSLGSSCVIYMLGLSYSPWLLSCCGLTMAPFFATSMDFVAHQFRKNFSYALSLTISLSSLVIVCMYFGVGYLTQVKGIAFAIAIGPMFLMSSLIMILLYRKFFKKA